MEIKKRKKTSNYYQHTLRYYALVPIWNIIKKYYIYRYHLYTDLTELTDYTDFTDSTDFTYFSDWTDSTDFSDFIFQMHILLHRYKKLSI